MRGLDGRGEFYAVRGRTDDGAVSPPAPITESRASYFDAAAAGNRVAVVWDTPGADGRLGSIRGAVLDCQ